jgi:hypothetical protein
MHVISRLRIPAILVWMYLMTEKTSEINVAPSINRAADTFLSLIFPNTKQTQARRSRSSKQDITCVVFICIMILVILCIDFKLVIRLFYAVLYLND